MMGYWDEQMSDAQIEQLAEEADVTEDVVRAFANHYEGTDFDADQIEDQYYGAWDGTLASWYWEVYLPDTNPESFEKLTELAETMGLMVDEDCVDEIAVEQDFTLIDGHVFWNH
jgi:hypothetical protein